MSSGFLAKGSRQSKAQVVIFLPVNNYREDEEQTESPGSDDEVVKQFDISVSC